MMDPVNVVTGIVCLAQEIHKQASLVGSNKMKCQALATTIQEVVTSVQNLSVLPRTQQFMTTLMRLDTCLQEAFAYMQKMSRQSKVGRFTHARRNEEALDTFKKDIIDIITRLDVGINAQQLINREQDRVYEAADRQALMANQITIFQEVQRSKLNPHELEIIIAKQLESFKDSFNQSSEKELLPENLTAHLYDIIFEKRLAQSALGLIYQGFWREQPVTIKVIDHVNSEDERDQFVREAQIMSRLRNEYIVPFYGACLERDRLCLLMGVMENGDVSDMLDCLSLGERFDMVKDLSCGLAYLHGEGVIHGNLTLKAIGVNRFKQAKWMDFGLSRTRTSSIATIGLTSQEAAWQAPESWQRRYALNEKSDIYSFGMIMWSLLCAQQPYARLSQDEIMDHVRSGRREPIPDDFPESLTMLIEACWSEDVMRRPTAVDISRSLRDIVLEPPRAISPTGEMLYEEGVSAEKSRKMEDAYCLYERACDKGYVKAYTRVGLFKLQGLGGQAVDKASAQESLTHAANNGHELAMATLAKMYEKGDVLSGTNLLMAMSWYERALESNEGNQRYKDKINLLSTRVQSDQVEECSMK